MKVYGAAILYDLVTPLGRLRLVGEVHGTAEHQCNFADFAQEHTGEIWCELERADAIHATSVILHGVPATKPLNVCARECIFADQPQYKLINIRRASPFYIIESMLHPQAFTAVFCNNTPSKAQKRAMKQFEKSMVEHMRTRTTTMNLLNSLLMNDPPAWYQHHIDVFKRQEMVAKSADFNVTEPSVIAFAQAHWTTMILNNDVYSTAMSSFKSTRETATDEPMVLDKYERELRDFFVKLFAVLMDVHILSKYLSEKPKDLVIVAGVNHVSRIIDFLVQNDKIDTSASAVCADITNGRVNLNTECIDTSKTYPFATISTRLPVTSPLNAFRERRREQKL